jgi:hypothetical protein
VVPKLYLESIDAVNKAIYLYRHCGRGSSAHDIKYDVGRAGSGYKVSRGSKSNAPFIDGD